MLDRSGWNLSCVLGVAVAEGWGGVWNRQGLLQKEAGHQYLQSKQKVENECA